MSVAAIGAETSTTTNQSTTLGQDEQFDGTSGQSFQQSIWFHLKNDRLTFNASQLTEPLPFQRRIIGYVYAFFVLYLLLIGIVGVALMPIYLHSFQDNFAIVIQDDHQATNAYVCAITTIGSAQSSNARFRREAPTNEDNSEQTTNTSENLLQSGQSSGHDAACMESPQKMECLDNVELDRAGWSELSPCSADGRRYRISKAVFKYEIAQIPSKYFFHLIKRENCN